MPMTIDASFMITLPGDQPSDGAPSLPLPRVGGSHPVTMPSEGYGEIKASLAQGFGRIVVSPLAAPGGLVKYSPDESTTWSIPRPSSRTWTRTRCVPVVAK